MAQQKPKRADIYSRGQEKIRLLEEAGDISGRTAKEAKDEADVDAVFDTSEDTEEESKTYNWWENLFGGD